MGLTYAQKPAKLRRICRDGANNTVFFYPSDDTCSRFEAYYVWARIGSSGAYQVLDTITNKNQDTYIHVDANPVGAGTPDWNYFLLYVDSCNAGQGFSDTLFVDVTPPEKTLIDSVSVDITTNKVQIGWHFNRTPDFSFFTLYYVDGSQYNVLPPANMRDTFYIDNISPGDPTNISMHYDLNSFDSCLKGTIAGFTHATILLKGNTDTCLSQDKLNWTAYQGWPQVRSYYIYKNNNNSGYILIDSVPGTQLYYVHPTLLGDSNKYFVRAFKDTSIIVSSSSGLLH